MIITTLIRQILFKFHLKRAVKRYKGRAVCMNCFSVLDWFEYEKREVRILPTHKVMLFCENCHELATRKYSRQWVFNAFSGWFTFCSGLPKQKYVESSTSFMKHYGHEAETKPD